MLRKYLKSLKLKKTGQYHDLYAQSNTLLLADVLENFKNKCIKIYELHSALDIKKNYWGSRKKQVGILKTLKPKELETIKDKSDDNEKDLKYEEGFNELSNKRIGAIYNISKKN